MFSVKIGCESSILGFQKDVEKHRIVHSDFTVDYHFQRCDHQEPERQVSEQFNLRLFRS